MYIYICIYTMSISVTWITSLLVVEGSKKTLPKKNRFISGLGTGAESTTCAEFRGDDFARERHA